MSLPRMVVWEPLVPDFGGTDLVRLAHADGGYCAEGSVTAVEVGVPWAVRFTVHADVAWRTRRVAVEAISAAGVARLVLEADGAGAWRCDGVARPDLAGCLDVDLAATPFTNTLVLRRLALGAGGAADVRVVRVGAPELSLRVVTQRYTRLAQPGTGQRYELVSWDPAVRAVLSTDDEGLVVHYEGLARRIATL